MAATRTTETLGVRITPDEKAQLEAEARAHGVTLSTLVYRRALNQPVVKRPRGRRPQHERQQDEGLFMTG